MNHREDEIYFVSGDIYEHVTGGTLCDRMIVEKLEQLGYGVRFIKPQTTIFRGFQRPLVIGLLNNVRNLFRVFPRRSLLFLDHGNYRDCFVAANFWKWAFACRIVGIVYHLDFTVRQIKGGRSLRGKIEQCLLRCYDSILTISRSTADQLHFLGFAPRRIDKMPVSRRFSPQDIRSTRPQVGEVTFLFVGSIEPRKGLADAIAALGRSGAYTSVVFNCVGRCDLEHRYVKGLVAAAEKLPNLKLQFTGTVSHETLENYLRSADAFLFPSEWEGYGIAVEEAMCFGLPVIAYAAGAVPELVEDGRTGWLAPVGDVCALAAAVRECILSPEERERRGREGLLRVRQIIGDENLQETLKTAIARALS